MKQRFNFFIQKACQKDMLACVFLDKGFVIGQFHKFILPFNETTPFVESVQHYKHLLIVDGISAFFICEFTRFLGLKKVYCLCEDAEYIFYCDV